MKLKSKILIIAGSDSSGGAGIQADIKTVTSLGGYAMTAITAITAQNTKGVKSVFAVKPKEIEKQIIFTCKDIKPNSVKIGMLNSSQVIKSVSKSLKETTSALIKFFSKSLCITPAALCASVFIFIVHALDSSGPEVKKVFKFNRS